MFINEDKAIIAQEIRADVAQTILTWHGTCVCLTFNASFVIAGYSGPEELCSNTTIRCSCGSLEAEYRIFSPETAGQFDAV